MKARLYHSTPLILDCWHMAGSGADVLRLVGTNVVMDLAALRADPGQRIVTDSPEAVCRLLGIECPDEQVVEDV